MAVDIDIKIVPWPEVARDLHEVAERAEDLSPPFRDVMHILEEVHRRGFARLKGRYVRTGATMRSLTGPSGDAIRDVEDQQAVFGTNVWYAHFLTKAPRDPNLGQVRKKPPGEGKHAVLFVSRTTQRRITEHLLHHITGPYG